MSTLIINAGLSGTAGNSHLIARHCEHLLAAAAQPHETIVLRGSSPDAVRGAIRRAERLVLISGTYWGGCSSLLQSLLEELTPTEGTELWLGKPAAVLISAHQVGAQTVLWRLQGVLVTLGCLIPPMSGVVITRTGEALRRYASELCADVWGLDDVETALANLCAVQSSTFRTWPVDHEHFDRRWLEEP